MRRVLLAIGLVLLATGAGGCALEEPRASGITERWLAAVNDQGRDRLHDKSVERAEEYGDQALVDEVVPPNAEEDERHFSDYEVGKSIESGTTARVPYRLTARLEGGDTQEVEGTAVLTKTPGSWRVTGIDPRDQGELVPSQGGERPASASKEQWFLTVVIGLVVTLLCVIAIRAQPRSTATPSDG
jgi:hypothetical protein